jgi:hypothetical protein
MSRRRPRGGLAALRTLAFAMLLGAVAVGAAGAGCGGPAAVVRPGPPPRAEDLLRALAARQTALHAMNARARATSWVGGQRLRATVLMLVERTGQLRFEAEVSLQGTVSILTTRVAGEPGGGRFQLLDLRNNRLQQGPACPENVAALMRIPLAPTEVAAILLGDLELPRGLAVTDAAVTWDPARGADVLVIKCATGERRVLFRPDANPVEILGASAATGAGPLWRASYEDLVDADAAAGGGGARLRLPSLIRFAERAGSFDDGVEIRFKDRTPNAETSAESFVIAPPAGADVIEVGCGAGGQQGAPRP